MKNRFKVLFIALILILGVNFLTLSMFEITTKANESGDNNTSDFFAFEQSVIELNNEDKPVIIEDYAYESDCLNEDNTINLERLNDYCIENDSYYISTQDGYEVYSNFGLKRLIVQGDLKQTYNASSVYSYGKLHILTYLTEEETEFAYNNLIKDDTLDVSFDKYENLESYADNSYDYSVYKNWGAEAADIGGYRKYLVDNNVNKEIVVVVLDTGLNTSHEMFTNRLLKDGSNKIVGYSYYNSHYQYSYNNIAFDSGDSNKYSFEDDGGHGSHVAGIICDLTPSNVKILPIKIGNPDNKNSSSSSIMLSAYLRVLNVYSTRYNIVATNLSYTGGGKNSTSERDTFNQQCYTPLKNKKILPVTAAGNDAEVIDIEGLEAVVVSSLMKNVKEYTLDSSYSNYGKIIDIAAPGSSIKSAYINSSNGAGKTVYRTLDGTSMASPQVAGIVALLYLNPQLASGFTANDIEQTLYDYSVDLGSPGKDIYYGHGMINLRYFEVEETGTLSFYKNNILIDDYCDYDIFEDEFNLKVQCSKSNFTIIYTTDKSIPTINNKTTYTSPIAIKNTIFINVMGVKVQNGAIVERTPMYNLSFFNANTPIEDCFVINTAGTITEYTGKFTKLEIPAKIDNIQVKTLGTSLFKDERIESIKLPSSCTTLNGYAFYGCADLKYVYAPGVTKTYIAAFYECSSIKFVTDESPSSNATEGVYLPAIKDMHSWTFGYCTSMESVKLTKVDTFSSEDGRDFIGCTNLKSVDLPLIPKITLMYFYNCTSLETLTIGKNVSSIGEDAFKNVKLKNIYCNSANKTYYADGYALYNANSLVYFAPAYTGDYEILGRVTINGSSKTITKLENFAMDGATVGDLTIPSSITQIGEYFARNAQIDNLYYNATTGESTLYYGSGLYHYPFYYAKIDNIIVGSNVRKVPERLFYYANPKIIVINSVNTTLESYSFYCYSSETNYSYDVYLELSSISSTWVTAIGNSKLTSYVDVLYSKVKITSTSSYIPKYLGVSGDYYIYSKSGYKITSSVYGNGEISPLGDVAIFAGEKKTFNIMPDVGWFVKDVKVNNVSVGAVDTYTFSNVTRDTTIVAEFEQISANYYVITVECGEGGSITPGYDLSIVEGGSKTFTIIPDTGYMISAVLVDGRSIGAVNTYTFNNVVANHTISVTFEKQKFVINATYGANGLILPSGVANVRYGDSKKYEFVPNLGYHVNSIKIDDVDLVGNELTNAINNGYTFKDISKNYKIYVDFAINTYTINATSGGNGEISPSGIATYNYNTSKVYIITPNKGYHISSIVVNNEPISELQFEDIVQNGYKFNGIKQNYTIHVDFAINIYNIIASANEGGVISPSGTIQVTHGSNKKFVFNPSQHYYVYSIVIDGNALSGTDFTNAVNNGYTFTNIENEHTINVVFDLVSYNITVIPVVNGSISPNGVVPVKYNQDKTFAFIPDTGYELNSIVVDGVALPVLEFENAKVNGYTFDNVVEEHTITATFKLKTYKVEASTNDYGSVSPRGENIVEHGNDFIYTFTPHDGYKVNKVFVNGENVGAFDTYTLEDVACDYEVYVEFVRVAYNITANVIGNGSITPSGVTSVYEGNSLTYVFTPASKHKIKDVKVNNISIGTPSSYAFINVTSDQTLTVEFEEIIVTLSLICGENGTINSGDNPLGSTSISITAGGYQRLDFAPNDGYKVKDVKIDNVSIGAVEYYTFINLDTSHTISVEYELKKYNININIDGQGSIDCDDVLTSIDHGDSRILNVNPDTKWKIYKVYINGELAEVQDDLIVINSVKDNLDIQAVFVEDNTILGIDATIFIIIIGCLAISSLLITLIMMVNKKRINIVNSDNSSYEKEDIVSNNTRVVESKQVQKKESIIEEEHVTTKPQPVLPNRPSKVPPKPQGVNIPPKPNEAVSHLPPRPVQGVNKLPPRPPQRPNSEIK